MISIRSDQLARLQQAMFRIFANEMLPTVRLAWPSVLAAWPDAAVIDLITRAAEKASGYGIDSAPFVLAVLNAMIVCGEEFDSDPRFAGLTALLQQRDAPLSPRMRAFNAGLLRASATS